jgi:hypothetical protein
MPPFVIPSVARVAAAALGVGAVGVIARWAVNEFRRMNDELDRVKSASIIEPDLRTGDWRVTEKGGAHPIPRSEKLFSYNPPRAALPDSRAGRVSRRDRYTG